MSKPSLWRVTMEFELVVAAADEQEAERTAEYHANRDGSEPSLTFATEVRQVDDVSHEWRDSIPFGGDHADYRTVRERMEETPQPTIR